MVGVLKLKLKLKLKDKRVNYAKLFICLDFCTMCVNGCLINLENPSIQHETVSYLTVLI